jgi:hypothetical protein
VSLRESIIVAALTLAIGLMGCADSEGNDEVGLFSRSVSLDTQFAKLESCGIRRNAGVSDDDLQAFENTGAMEASPYAGLVEALALDIEREPYSPMANSIWMCDYERIEDHGAYKDIVERLELMTDSALQLTDVTDNVDWETETAWVQFNYKGRQIRWDAEFDNDWMDPEIVVKYDQLLKESGSGIRIYSNHTDYGQSALFAAFSKEQFDCFRRLSKIRLELIE